MSLGFYVCNSLISQIYLLEKKGKRGWWSAHEKLFINHIFLLLKRWQASFFFMGLGHRWRTLDTVLNNYQVTAVRPKTHAQLKWKLTLVVVNIRDALVVVGGVGWVLELHFVRICNGFNDGAHTAQVVRLHRQM